MHSAFRFLVVTFFLVSCGPAEAPADGPPFYSSDPEIAAREWIGYNGDSVLRMYDALSDATTSATPKIVPVPARAWQPTFPVDEPGDRVINAAFFYTGSGPSGEWNYKLRRAGRYAKDTARFVPEISDTTIFGELLALDYAGVIRCDAYTSPSGVNQMDFRPGMVKGVFRLFDVRTGALLLDVPFEVTNSDKVHYVFESNKDVDTEKLQERVEEDLMENVEEFCRKATQELFRQ